MISQKSKNLLHAKVSEAITDMHEQQLIHDLDKLFSHVCKNVLIEISKYWDNLLIKGQVDLILAPLHEAHKQYYTTIIKYKHKTYNNSRSTGKRIVKNIKKNKTPLATYSDKSQNLLSNFTKNDYFGINDYSEKIMQTRTFKASEKTLNRIDKDINNILAEGYHEGWGQNAVANKITKRFNQIRGWEAKRIARTEIHNAQNMGIMQGYQDMGVEYTQWSSATDNRVRDTHHELNGEIIPFGGTYSNGLQYPGDTTGPIGEWINCRCGNLPFIMPDGYIAPQTMNQFRESDLIKIDVPDYEDLINSATQEAKQIPEGYDKYALTSDELKRLNELKNKEKLSLLEKNELKELKGKSSLDYWHKEKLNTGLSPIEEEKYSRLVNIYAPIENFETNVASTWKYTEKDKQLKKQIFQKFRKARSENKKLSDEYINLRHELIDKEKFSQLHQDILNGHDLDYEYSKQYLQLYNKYKTKWNLPKLNTSHFTTLSQTRQIELGGSKWTSENLQLVKKFKLTKSESKELDDLLLKRLLTNKNLSTNENNRLKDLYNQKWFNVLHSRKIQDGGLNYKDYLNYEKLFNKLKTKLNITKDLLKSTVKSVKSNIPFDPNKKHKFIKLKGITQDGSLPGNNNIDDFFTVDVTQLSNNEKRVLDRWLANDYRAFRDYLTVCDGNKQKFIKYIEDVEDFRYKPWIGEKGDGRTLERITDFANDIEYDCPTLLNILKNQTKKSMTFWRRQDNPHLGENPKVGDIIHWKGINATSVTKEGPESFKEFTNTKTLEWEFEIEAPTGTKGAYVAPQANGKFKTEMEFLLGPDTDFKIIKYNEVKKYAKLRIINQGG